MSTFEPAPSLSGNSVSQSMEIGSGRNVGAGNSIAFALMAMAREPFLILDRKLGVIAASRSYYELFPIKVEADHGRLVCQPSSLEWDSKALEPLHDAVSRSAEIVDCEVELDIPNVGKRSMLLNVRQAADLGSPDSAMLVGLEDVTDLRDMRLRQEERERLQATLLMEVHHRVANSLQIIASILSIKAVKSGSRETRLAIQDTLNRLTIVAALERRLCAPGSPGEIAFAPYLMQVCEELAGSMLPDDKAVAIVSSCDRGTMKSDEAASLGMIVTELVTNSLKYGFPDGRSGRIFVDYVRNDQGWRLSVVDDGVGSDPVKPSVSGVGTRIVRALAESLKARVEVSVSATGTSTAIVSGSQPQLSY